MPKQRLYLLYYQLLPVRIGFIVNVNIIILAAFIGLQLRLRLGEKAECYRRRAGRNVITIYKFYKLS